MERVPDEVLLEMAAQEGRVLVTHNVNFGAIISGIHETISGLSDGEWVDRVDWMRRARSR